MIAERDTVEYFKGLIALRKTNFAFDDLVSAGDKFALLERRTGAVVYRIGDFIYGVNNSNIPFDYPISGTAFVYADIDVASATPIASVSSSIRVAPHSVIAARIC